MTTLGIDPGARTGMAAYDRSDGPLRELRTVNANQAVLCALDMARIYQPELCIVEINRDTVYPRKGVSPRAMARIAKNVGLCIGRAEAIADALEAAGFRVLRRGPIKGGTNWDGARKALWEDMMDWHKASSTHARDAAVLAAFG